MTLPKDPIKIKETKEKMKLVRKGKSWEEIFGIEKGKEMRRNMGLRQKEKPYASYRTFSDETKKQMSLSAKKRIGKGCKNSFKKGKENVWYNISAESRVRHSEKKREWCLNNKKVLKKRMEETQRNNPNMKYKGLIKMQNNFKFISKQEQIMKGLLPVDFIHNKRFHNTIPDFRSEERKIIIEVDGVYWHSFEKVVEKDKRNNEERINKGYKIFRIPHTDVNKYLKPLLEI